MRKGRFAFAVLLAVVMVFNTGSFQVFATTADNLKKNVVSIEELEQTEFEVVQGTALSDVSLPKSVTAKVEITDSDEETVEKEKNLKVQWTGTYRANETGTYKLTSELEKKEEYPLAKGVKMPQVNVVVYKQQARISTKTSGVSSAKKAAPGISTLADGDGDSDADADAEEFDPMRVSADRIDTWTGYDAFKDFFDKMPSEKDVAEYDPNGEEAKQLRADMEKARTLAKSLEDFMKKMQDPKVLEDAYDKYMERELAAIEEEGYELTEEEIAQYKEQMKQNLDWAIESWKNIAPDTMKEQITDPMEELFDKYLWYLDKKDDKETVVKEGFATIKIPEGVNEVVKTEDDFVVGKEGAKKFTIATVVDFNGFSNVEGKKDKVAVIRLPKGFKFSSNKFNSTNGESYKFTPHGDGKQELAISFPDSFDGKFYQTFLIEQDPTAIINNLKNTKGNLDFSLNVFTGYRTDSQKKILSDENEKDDTSKMTFKVDAQTPKLNVTIKKGKETDYVYPQEFDSYHRRESTAGLDAARYHNGSVFVIEIEKTTEGYLSDDFLINLNLPGADEKLIKRARPDYYFTPENGEKNAVGLSSKYNELNESIPNFATLSGESGWNGEEFYAMRGEKNKGMSFAEAIYGKGTITLEINPEVYINNMYRGDWEKTSYKGDKNVEASVLNFEKEDLENTESETPLYFNLKNGDAATGYNESIKGLQKEMPQYGKKAEYEDTDWLQLSSVLQEKSPRENGFAFYDDFTLAAEFSEELSPVNFRGLKTDKDFGFSYRFYITDAKTGKVTSIETILGEEETDSYKAKDFDGVKETIVSGENTKAWTLEGANNKENSKYVSKVEIFKTEYEFNPVFAHSSYYPVEMQLRARHHKLSDPSVDIEDNFEATFKTTLTANNPDINFVHNYAMNLRHLSDNLELGQNTSCDKSFMEVNNHQESGKFFGYTVVKYADTQKYNVTEDGDDKKFGDKDYNPVVVELSGDAVTVTDRVRAEGQIPVGVWGSDGKYYDFAENGIKPDDFRVQTAAVVKKGLEPYTEKSNHGRESGDPKSYGDLYDMKAIYDKLGIKYAEKIVVALTTINDKTVNEGSNKTEVQYSLAVNKLCPGYLNYDKVVGIKKDGDSDVTLKANASLYCQYEDYLASAKDGKDAKDSTDEENGPKHHGEKSVATMKAATVKYGTYVTKVSNATDSTKYVCPTEHSSSYSHMYDDDYDETKTAYGENGVDSNTLATFKMTLPNTAGKPQIDYKGVTYDFAGTDLKLLSLTNMLVFDNGNGSMMQNVKLEYTLSDGRQIVSEDDFKVYSSGKAYYKIPELGNWYPSTSGETEPYLTSLKITFPDELNWGNGHYKRSGFYLNERLPDVSLARFDKVIPLYYPCDPTQRVGTQHEDPDKGMKYDNWNAKLSVSFTDCMGNELADGKGDYVAEGLSKRIGTPVLYVDQFWNNTYYYDDSRKDTPAVYQNETVNVENNVNLTYSHSLRSDGNSTSDWTDMLQAYGVTLKPTFYYVIDKNFTYVPNSLRLGYGYSDTEFPAEDMQVRYLEPKDGEDGLLIISYEDTKNGFKTGVNPRLDFKLRANYDAKIGNATPVKTAWADVPYNRNLDGSYPATNSIAVDTKNTVAGAPYGKEVGNVGKINLNDDGECEMLKAVMNGRISVQEKVFSGMLNYVEAYAPKAEDEQSVSSKDILKEKNLFGAKTFITGDASEATHDWELYTVVPKKGGTIQYIDADKKVQTNSDSEFSLVLNGMDTSKLDEAGVDYKLYYTTDANPANGGYASMKDASWKALDPKEIDKIDAEKVTGVKLWINELKSKQKVSLESMFKLENHKSEVGEEVAFVMSFVNFKKGSADSGENALAGGENGYSGAEPLEYHLEDMAITGFAWNEKDYNSIYNDGDDLQEGVAVKVFDEDGNEIVQPNAKGRNADLTNVTNEDGEYKVLVPHDGKWQLSVETPAGMRLTKKMVTDNAAVNSAFDRTTKKTDVLDFESDYTNMKFTFKNVNAGLSVLPKLDIPEKVYTHVGDENEDEFKVTVENRVPGTTPEISLKDGEPADIADVKDGGDDTATFDGKKTGTVKGKVTIDDGYGGTVDGEFTVIVGSNVKYDVTNRIADNDISKTTGKTPVDNNNYYPSVDKDGNDAGTDVATLDKGKGFASSGYVLTGWATSEDDAKDGKVTYKTGEEVKLGDCTEDLLLYAVWKKCTPVVSDPPVSKKITGDTPKEDAEFHFVLTAKKNDIGLDKMPMPEEAAGEQSMVKSITGAGSTEFGDITFELPGVYQYTITEQNDGVENYEYDTSKYTVTYRVTQNGDALEVERTIKKGLKSAKDVVFTNKYTDVDYIDTPTPEEQPSNGGDDAQKSPSKGTTGANQTTHVTKTGDASDMLGWYLALAASLLALAIVAFFRRRSNHF